MEKFYEKLSMKSDITNYHKEHVPGRIGMYNGKDGIKYYVIVERTETPVSPDHLKYLQENPYFEERYGAKVPDDAINVSLKVAMVSNPDMEVGPRKPTRVFDSSCLKILNVDDWAQVQREFITAMLAAGLERTGIEHQ